MAHVNLDMDFDGTSTSIGTTLAKLLAVADEHPDGYSISAQFTGKPHTTDVQVQVAHMAAVDAMLVADALKPTGQHGVILAKRIVNLLNERDIYTLGELRECSRAQIMEIPQFGPAMWDFVYVQLGRHGIQLRKE
jgi:DNA-directed RNA polymerase alpha subunit